MSFINCSITAALTAVLILYVPNLVKPPLPKQATLWAAPKWRKVADTYRNLLDTGHELGGSFAVYYKGEKVVDLLGGYADPEAALPWAEHTVGQFYSTTKGVSAVVIAILVDRGLLDYSSPVRTYWPEFGVNGKEAISVEELLSHQAGLAIIDEEYTIDDIFNNPEKIARVHAQQRPKWRPGTATGYHSVSIGFYMDQLVRRVDPQHRSLAQFFDEEVAQYLGLDFVIGLPLAENWRCARAQPITVFSVIRDLVSSPELYPMVKNYFNKESLVHKAARFPVEFQNSSENDPYVRRAPIPASNGFGTADSLAKLFGILANGGSHGDKKLISEQTTLKLKEPLKRGIDMVIGLNVTLGRGMMIWQSPDGESQSFGTPGFGGQMAFADPTHHLGWAYLTNFHSIKLTTDNYVALWNAMYDTVYDLEGKVDKN